MKRTFLTQGLGRSIVGLEQAVLDCLPEALFLLDPASGEVCPINVAASKWTPAELREADAWNIQRLLPDLNVERLADLRTGFHLFRAVEPSSNQRREVILHIYSLGEQTAQSDAAEDRTDRGASELMSNFVVLGIREVSTGAQSTLSPDAYYDAFHDPLTRLPNRRLFHRRLERILQRTGRADYVFAVLFVDLDRFKSVNDRFGHALGDKILVSAAHRLVEAVRPQDMVARRDGDEFTILLDDLEQPEDAVGVAQRIVDYLQMPLLVEVGETTTVEVGASIGVVIGSDAPRSAEELISQADAAMYQAKALGGGVFLSREGLSGHREPSATRTRPLPR
jgi:diguanylate cyclase (GGDEF)-like protein